MRVGYDSTLKLFAHTFSLRESIHMNLKLLPLWTFLEYLFASSMRVSLRAPSGFYSENKMAHRKPSRLTQISPRLFSCSSGNNSVNHNLLAALS